MNFNSRRYFLFLLFVFILFQWVPARARWLVLLLSSVAFYLALGAPHLVVVLLAVTTLTYAAGLGLARCRNEKTKRAILWVAIGANILIWVLSRCAPSLLEYFHLPVDSDMFTTIGVSYFCSQAISYVIDVFLGTAAVEAHFGYFALYMAFFPKLLQGPIERAGDMLPQFHKRYEFNYDDARKGLVLFTWGLFKKVVVANNLAPFVDVVYKDAHSFQGISLICATYLFALQIYFDFSGYTDMAMGSAQLFGIRLTANFNSPYGARSIADFWRRWHISFSRWLSDYIFKPLQFEFRRAGTLGTVAALLITFLGSGLWHGLNVNFVVWGLLHGFFLSTAIVCGPIIARWHKRLGWESSWALAGWQRFATFNLVCFAWIFFRAESFADACYLVAHLFDGFGTLSADFKSMDFISRAILMGQDWRSFWLILGSVSIVTLVEWKRRAMDLFAWPVWMRWGVYYSLVITILAFGVFDASPFLYFKF